MDNGLIILDKRIIEIHYKNQVVKGKTNISVIVTGNMFDDMLTIASLLFFQMVQTR